MRLVLTAALTLVSAITSADQIYTAEAVPIPQIMQDDQGYKACGVRVMLLSAGPGSTSGADFSLLVSFRPKLGAMFKAGGMRCPGSCKDPSDAKFVHATDYRLSTVKDGIPLKLIKTFPTDDPAFTMAVGDPLDAMKLLMSIVKEERMQLAFTPDGTRGMREAYTFSAQPMSQDEKASFDSCINGASTLAKKELEKE